MTKPITLKEAELFDFELYQKKQLENQKKEDSPIIDSINNFIAVNLQELKTKPISVNFYYVYQDQLERIQKQYPEFTLSSGPNSGRLNIKLSNKNWDWNGYGKPNTEYKVSVRKRNWLQKLFNK